MGWNIKGKCVMNGTKVPGTKAAKIVFDTCAVVFLLDEDERILAIRQDLIDAREYVSVINRIELFAKPDITDGEIQEINAFLADTTVIPIGEAIEEETIKLRRANPAIKLPDSIIAATAIVMGATLLTDDPQLKKLVWPGYTVQAI
jgi:predicted nucleic acid-binding protein